MNSIETPSLFLGHGSPMNALAVNPFTEHLFFLGKNLQTVKGLIVISAHWITDGVQITSHEKNPLIYDFYGFPDELFKVQFLSHGSKRLADEIAKRTLGTTTDQWGLDHGAWTMLKHMFKSEPAFPILQVSLNKNWNLKQHFEFAESLRIFRDAGYLVLGSGNIVHNLREISWSENAPTPDWAIEFDQFVANSILDRNYAALFQPSADKISLWKQAHPSIDHFLPLLYTCAVANPVDQQEFPYIGFQNGSLSMRSVKFS